MLVGVSTGNVIAGSFVVEVSMPSEYTTVIVKVPAPISESVIRVGDGVIEVTVGG